MFFSNSEELGLCNCLSLTVRLCFQNGELIHFSKEIQLQANSFLYYYKQIHFYIFIRRVNVKCD